MADPDLLVSFSNAIASSSQDTAAVDQTVTSLNDAPISLKTTIDALSLTLRSAQSLLDGLLVSNRAQTDNLVTIMEDLSSAASSLNLDVPQEPVVVVDQTTAGPGGVAFCAPSVFKQANLATEYENDWVDACRY